MNKSGRTEVKRLSIQEQEEVKKAWESFQDTLKNVGGTCKVCCLDDNSSIEIVKDFEIIDGICYINTVYS